MITNGYMESYVDGKTYMPPIMRKTDNATLGRGKKNIKTKTKKKKNSSRTWGKIRKTIN